MASVTFVGILSELVPSGILPQMTEGLGVEESEVGFLVGVYALASAIAAIPLISATLAFNRKTLLIALLIGFAASNIVVGLSSSYAVIIASRIVGGVCAGVMWPMIAAYGTRLVPEDMHGKAITVIMSGNTLGISIGLALLIFGLGSVISVIGSAKYIDAYLRPLIVVSLGIGGISMAMFLAFKGTIVAFDGTMKPARSWSTKASSSRSARICPRQTSKSTCRVV